MVEVLQTVDWSSSPQRKQFFAQRVLASENNKLTHYITLIKGLIDTVTTVSTTSDLLLLSELSCATFSQQESIGIDFFLQLI